nr:unnamed protein product [Digitaria exilis]
MPVLVEDRGGIVALLLVSLFFHGTWPALVTLLERRGRLPQHTYLDYSITNLLAAIIMALTLGQAGESTNGTPKFFSQVAQMQDNWPSVLFAMAGGIALGLANLLLQYAFAFLGLSVTTVIFTCLVAVTGTTMNYFLDGRINRAAILFPGVGCFLIAALLGSVVHASNVKDDKDKLSMVKKRVAEDNTDVTSSVMMVHHPEELENGHGRALSTISQAEVGTAEFIIQVEERRSIKVFGSDKLLGIGLVLLSTVCASICSVASNLATNDQWHTLMNGTPHLVIYTVFFYFSVSCFLLEVCLNVWFLYQPRAGVPASTIGAYTRDWKGRNWALIAGLLSGFGNAFKLMGGQAAGYAASDAVLMLIVEDKGSAIALMLVSLFIVGTFPVLLTLLERRGRLPQHTYLDYSIANLLAAVMIAIAFGQFGESKSGMPNFLTQLTQDNWPSVLIAMAGGVALGLGNLIAQYAWAFAGLSVTMVMCSCMTVVVARNPIHQAKPGTAAFIIQLEQKRSIKLLGLNLIFLAGICFAIFLPAINLATNDQCHVLRNGVPHLVVYTAFFYFSLSCFALGVCLNVLFLYRPMAGVPASSIGAYVRDWNGRHWALLSGLLCGFGNGFQFMGGQAAGYAAADSVQALPLVSTFWGVVLFGEYRRSSMKTYILLVGMLSMFVAAVVLLIASAGHRKT